MTEELTQEEKDLLDYIQGGKIENLEISVRAYNILRNSGLNTIDEVCRMDRPTLPRLKNCGRKSATEIVAALGKRGRRLKKSCPRCGACIE